jgi:hypothetical protein
MFYETIITTKTLLKPTFHMLNHDMWSCIDGLEWIMFQFLLVLFIDVIE